MGGDATDKDALSEEAWRQLHEAVTTGLVTLPSGDTREVTTHDLLKINQWLASLSASRIKKPTKLPEDFALGKTET